MAVLFISIGRMPFLAATLDFADYYKSLTFVSHPLTPQKGASDPHIHKSHSDTGMEEKEAHTTS